MYITDIKIIDGHCDFDQVKLFSLHILFDRNCVES